MSFVPARRAVATYPIKATVYDENGEKSQIEFIGIYVRDSIKTVDDLRLALANKNYQARVGEPLKRPDGSTPPEWSYDTDFAFISDKLVGWKDVKSADGAELPYSAERLKTMLDDYPELAIPLFGGYFDAHQGVREKN